MEKINKISLLDLLFLESSEVIFRVALALLEEHQDQLLACDSFEEIMEYLKVNTNKFFNLIFDNLLIHSVLFYR